MVEDSEEKRPEQKGVNSKIILKSILNNRMGGSRLD
jgi:hypothetical protein